MELAAVLPETITPYISLMIGGFFVGIAGHLYGSKIVVGFGIAMIFAATLLLPLALIVSQDDPEPQFDRPTFEPGSR